MNSDPVLENRRKRAIYVMAEAGCLAPQSGAFVHINTGIKELSKYSTISILSDRHSAKFISHNGFLPKMPMPNGEGGQSQNKINKIKGTFSDIKTLISKAMEFRRFYRFIKSYNPDFIYERASYLNFNTFLICRMLKIPHFFEVNGILGKDVQMYYPSYLNKLARFLEKGIYQKSTYCFCVGGVGQELGLETRFFQSVQNGVTQDLLEIGRDINHNPHHSGIHICYVGYIMKHHNIDCFHEIFSYLEQYDIHFHFFGQGFDQLTPSLSPKVKFTDHGIVAEAHLIPMLAKFHIAIIPEMQREGSNMKIFLYAASRLLVVLPGYPNVQGIFRDREHVLFFEPNNMQDCAAKVSFAIRHPSVIDTLGENLSSYVTSNFTWEIIFKKINHKIDSLLV